MIVNREGDTLFAGTEKGIWTAGSSTTRAKIELHESTRLPDTVAVTALTMVFGDVSLAVGDAEGNVTTWAPVRTEESGEANRCG